MFAAVQYVSYIDVLRRTRGARWRKMFADESKCFLLHINWKSQYKCLNQTSTRLCVVCSINLKIVWFSAKVLSLFILFPLSLSSKFLFGYWLLFHSFSFQLLYLSIFLRNIFVKPPTLTYESLKYKKATNSWDEPVFVSTQKTNWNQC